MKRKNAARNAFFSSAISLLLCVSMLVGTTFAWFTDSVVSGVNNIAAGNLDVELYHGKDKDPVDEVKADTLLFTDAGGNVIDLWEPGVVAFTNLKVANVGTLALKYQLSINSTEVNYFTDADGVQHTLAEALKVAVVEGGVSGTREEVVAAASEWQKMVNFTLSGVLEADKKSDTYGIVVYWEPGDNDYDNLFNMNNGKKTNDEQPLTITLGVNLFATQEMYEDDSFGPDYDKGAAWTGNVDTDWYFANPDAAEFVITSGEELAGLAALVNGTAAAPVATLAADAENTVHDDFAGKTVKLGANVDLRDVPWTPIGRIGTTSTDFTYAFKGTFDGQGYTVSNLYVNAYGWAGLFGMAHSAQINNLKINGVEIHANRMAGAVVGQLYGSIDNCHVADADIVVVPNAVGDSYDNGDKVGGIVGWIGDNGNNRTLTNCSATNVALGAYRDVGGIAGYVASSTTVSGNKAANLEITVDQNTFHYGEKDPNAGTIYGRTGGTITDENNTEGENVVINSTYSKGGITYKQDGITGETVLYLVPASYEGDTVNVAEGTTTIGGYAFAYNSNIDKIVLPSTVTTLNDRAFRDTAASTVVLNEGLTNISYQAFRNASNVKSVVIPSTVTTISKEAFQNSGITTLTIPATVNTLEYGACRDMKNLETVTIEGNVDIPVYAFRACTNLKTVILTGDDVTFGGGSRGMIFTTKENGDGSAITVYVANETVKARLLAADTAAKDYGGYKIVLPTFVSGEDAAAELSDALSNGEDVVMTGDMNFNASETTASNGYGAVGVCVSGSTLDGNGNSLGISNWNTWDSAINITSGTIKNLTVNSGMRGIFVSHNGTAGKVYLENVIIDGTIYTISCDQGTNSGLEAKNSTFNGWTSYAATIGDVLFTNCSFGEGQGYAFCRPYAPTEFVNCNFAEGFQMDAQAAVTFENCTIGGVPLTAENLATLVTSNIANASVK